MVKKILFLFFLFAILNIILGVNTLVIIEVMFLVIYRAFILSSDHQLELIMETYNVNDEDKNASTNEPFSLEKKLNSLPNKKGAIQLEKLKILTQSFEEIISFKKNEDNKSIAKYKQDTVNEFYQAVEDNLHHYYLVMKSIEPINSKIMYEASIYSKEEKNYLIQEWLTLSLKQKKCARDVLVENEEAITQLNIFITDIVKQNQITV
jgi:hypothetical protein